MIPYHTDAKFFCSHDQVVLSQLWPSTGWFQNGVYTTLVRYEGGGRSGRRRIEINFAAVSLSNAYIRYEVYVISSGFYSRTYVTYVNTSIC